MVLAVWCKMHHRKVFCYKQTKVKKLPIIKHPIYRPNRSATEMTEFSSNYLEPVHNTISVVTTDSIPVYEDVNN